MPKSFFFTSISLVITAILLIAVGPIALVGAIVMAVVNLARRVRRDREIELARQEHIRTWGF